MSIQGEWGSSVTTVGRDKQVTVTMGTRPNGMVFCCQRGQMWC